MSKSQFEHLYVDYVLDQLERDEREEFLHHLTRCPECGREIGELREVLFSLPLVLPLSEPPARVRDRILREASGAHFPRYREKPGILAWQIWAIAASVLLVAVGVFTWTIHQSNFRLQSQMATLEQENERLRESNQALGDRVALLTSPDTRFLRMAGLERYEQASGSAFLQPGQRAALVYLHNLPSLPAQRDFQMWVIAQGRPPFPSKTFQASAEPAEISFNLPIAADQVAMLAITIEPVGGSPQPTGPMVLASR